MKRLITVSFILSLASLAAQGDNLTPAPGTPTSYSSYLNGDNPKYYVNGVALYPNYPVTAAEYCTFLQQYASNESCWFYSEYYDSAFMTTSEDWVANKQACIYRSGWSPKYSYTVIPGHESDIIDALQSKQIQEDFRRQRQLPSVKDVCDYLNAKFQGDNDTAIAIRANYANQSFSLTGYSFDAFGTFNYWLSSVNNLFEYADHIAAERIDSFTQGSIVIPKAWFFKINPKINVLGKDPFATITFEFNGSFYQAASDTDNMYLRPTRWEGIEIKKTPLAQQTQDIAKLL